MKIYLENLRVKDLQYILKVISYTVNTLQPPTSLVQSSTNLYKGRHGKIKSSLDSKLRFLLKVFLKK